MSMQSRIREILMVEFEPVRLDVVNESHLHAGHRSSPGTGDSHFRVLIVSQRFEGMSRVGRHRLVNGALGAIVGKQVHAFALTALAPGEAPGQPSA